jgi:hypothetical protein
MLIILVDFYDVYMCTNSNYLGPFRNRFPLKFVPETSIVMYINTLYIEITYTEPDTERTSE